MPCSHLCACRDPTCTEAVLREGKCLVCAMPAESVLHDRQAISLVVQYKGLENVLDQPVPLEGAPAQSESLEGAPAQSETLVGVSAQSESLVGATL